MRIAVLHNNQETDDFSPIPTTLESYENYGVYEGKAVEALKKQDQVGGFYTAIEESGLDIEPVPLMRAYAGAGGRLTREVYDHFTNRIRAGLEGAGRLDGLVLKLHGACSAEGFDDVSGEWCALARSILGPDVPIVLRLDHHANVTQKMIDNVDAVVGHRTQPHDIYETGLIATRLLIRIINEKLKPTIAWRKIPLISHGEQFATSHGPMKIWFDRARAMEAEDPAVLEASNYPMQPWMDVTEAGWSTIVCTNNDQALAEKLADELADLAWSMRDDFQVRTAVPVDEAVLRADASDKGVVLISDVGDTVFGGALGDSNVLLEAMLRLNIKGPALVPLISPAAARQLHEAGEGATVTIALGGDGAPVFFKPLTVTGVVMKVGGGVVDVPAFARQPKVDFGKAVLFQVGPVILLITEKKGVAGNLPDAYRALGLDPTTAKMAVLKTVGNPQYFAPISSGELILADTAGPAQSDILTLPWKRLTRPIYPLDRLTDWREHSSQPGPAYKARR